MERVWKKLKGWKEKCLSGAGKETLIKAVAQAIPNYILSCYEMPISCCNEIDAMLAKFWWGSDEEHRRIHWMSWGRLSRPKCKGGMGFRGFRDFNLALLGKHCWRLANGDNSLLTNVLKSKYYPNSNFLNAHLGHQPSYGWRSIMSARSLVKEGGKWIIGNGSTASIWKDRWLGDDSFVSSRSASNTLEEDACVSSLIDFDRRDWNRPLIFQSFSQEEARKIISVPLSLSLPCDKLVWRLERDGCYSVKSAYHSLCVIKERNWPSSSSSVNDKLWKEIWKAKVPNRVRNFLWRLSKLILPTRSNLAKKGILLDVTCPLCHSAAETHDHLFLNCNIARLTLFASNLGCNSPPQADLSQ